MDDFYPGDGSCSAARIAPGLVARDSQMTLWDDCGGDHLNSMILVRQSWWMDVGHLIRPRAMDRDLD